MASSPEYPDRDRVAIASSGDSEKDRRDLERHHVSERREAEGLCPNGCGPLEYPAQNERHCPDCGFTGYTVTVGVSGKEIT